MLFSVGNFRNADGTLPVVLHHIVESTVNDAPDILARGQALLSSWNDLHSIPQELCHFLKENIDRLNLTNY